MQSLRGTITTVTLAAVLLAGTAPAAARAGSLLSGYGGPGEGNQAILGAALLNGPPSGGSGGGGSAGPGAGAPATSGTSNPAAGSPTQRGRGTGAVARGPRSGTRVRGAQGASLAGAALTPASPRAFGEAAVATPALGITGSDVLYILLGMGVLVVTATLTRQLVRGPRKGGAG